MKDSDSAKPSSKQSVITGKKPRFSKDYETTFKHNQQKPIHRWFSYVEGFSGDFVQKTFEDFKIKPDSVVLDPFSGSGTTLTESSLAGIQSYGYDINPFLTYVSKIKTNFSISTKKLQDDLFALDKKMKNFSNSKSIAFLSSFNLPTNENLLASPPHKSKIIHIPSSNPI